MRIALKQVQLPSLLKERSGLHPQVEVLDLTGQIKQENQLACCDVVYNLPFAGSCSGPFAQRAKTAPSDPYAEPSQAPGQQSQPGKDCYQTVNIQASADERTSFTLPPPGRLPPSMSDNNLASSSVQYIRGLTPGTLQWI